MMAFSRCGDDGEETGFALSDTCAAAKFQHTHVIAAIKTKFNTQKKKALPVVTLLR
jgi:hypothetical protein